MTKLEEFYVIVDRRQLDYAKGGGYGTRNLDEAQIFQSKEEALKELYTYDDDIMDYYDVYRVDRTIEIYFELVKE